MNYLMSVASVIKDLLNLLYSNLTQAFQSIHLDERLAFLCKYHLVICLLFFLAFSVYTVFFYKKQSFVNFENPVKLVITILLLFMYYFLADKSINLSSFGLGLITVHPFLLIIVAKLYGPWPAASFGAVEYLLSRIGSSDGPPMFAIFFIYAIGGMIHGLILYERKTAFWRCLLARLVTVVLCNVFLLALVRAGTYTHTDPLSVFIPQTITTNILQIPIQAILGYISLLLIKKLRQYFEF